MRNIERLAERIKNSNDTVALTGAGMSTESGLPDFRSSHGLWAGRDPLEIASPHAIEGNYEDFVSFYGNRIKELKKHKPNSGHDCLANWEQEGLLSAVLTQNIDGYHLDAGGQNVIELHGHLRHLYCRECRHRHPVSKYLHDDPYCEYCGGKVRPDVVLFGEALDELKWEKAIQEVMKADLAIVVGTSLEVFPFAGLVELALERGTDLAIINYTETGADALADIVIHDSISETLDEVNGNIKE
ncbi:MAG TPA: NAD-dependent protein deacylase [Bacillales bacterium]|nr:NAD-dependent protein deacylase [Bacillales bacterium]